MLLKSTELKTRVSMRLPFLQPIQNLKSGIPRKSLSSHPPKCVSWNPQGPLPAFCHGTPSSRCTWVFRPILASGPGLREPPKGVTLHWPKSEKANHQPTGVIIVVEPFGRLFFRGKGVCALPCLVCKAASCTHILIGAAKREARALLVASFRQSNAQRRPRHMQEYMLSLDSQVGAQTRPWACRSRFLANEFFSTYFIPWLMSVGAEAKQPLQPSRAMTCGKSYQTSGGKPFGIAEVAE